MLSRLLRTSSVRATANHVRSMSSMSPEVQTLYQDIAKRDPDQPEFLQAVEEVLDTMGPIFERDPRYLTVMRRLAEPERSITFRVPWVDDAGNEHVNRGFRVQFNSAIGPYKGGLRFHPSVNLSIVKFLGFEQIFKNSLTTLMMGGGKGGSDFDPKGKSDREVMAFCQSFMLELSKHIGADCDVPAGDIGVGGREIGYLFGQYKRVRNEFVGVLTGKAPGWGGSLIRPEATGYGAVYFANEIFKSKNASLEGKRCLVSGSGNVAQFAVQKMLHLGAVPLTMSDSSGYIHEPAGFTAEGLAEVMRLKNVERARISDYLNFSKTAEFVPNEKPWGVPCDAAFPCATQNELLGDHAKALVANGCGTVVEGANMPCDPAAIEELKSNGVVFGPAKAANAGGVAVSGLEMAQDSSRIQWTSEEVDDKLKNIMSSIHTSCVNAAEDVGKPGDLQAGANIAGFLKVAHAMIDQGAC
jgi:glutamate dehydrogenase (NADP+)